MNAPQAPLVVITASTKALSAKIEERMRDVAKKWKVRTGGSGEVNGREVIFTWMDAERWKEWMKSMYGLKVDDDDKDLDDVKVVIADHKVSALLFFLHTDQSLIYAVLSPFFPFRISFITTRTAQDTRSK